MLQSDTTAKLDTTFGDKTHKEARHGKNSAHMPEKCRKNLKITPTNPNISLSVFPGLLCVPSQPGTMVKLMITRYAGTFCTRDVWSKIPQDVFTQTHSRSQLGQRNKR